MPNNPVWRTAQEVAAIFAVKPGTVRMWAYRGYITTHPGDRYDVTEVRDWYDHRRDQHMDNVRRGIPIQPTATTGAGSTFTTAEAEACLGIKPRTLRAWVERGHVRRYGQDAYDAGDVARRWQRLARTGHLDQPTETDGGPN